MGKSYVEPANMVESNSTIKVTISNLEGEALAYVGLSWYVNYHSDEIEQEILNQSNNIIHAAMSRMKEEYHWAGEVNNAIYNGKAKFAITIIRSNWGKNPMAEFSGVEVDIG